jgi:hypothetical protein
LANSRSKTTHCGSTGRHKRRRMDNSCVRGKATPASVSRALRYFSAHYCEKKQILSHRDLRRDRKAPQAPS